MSRTITSLFIMVIMLSSVAFGQVQSGNNPNFVPEQPAAVGNLSDYGYQNRVVARWVSPQFETINQTTKMGMLAYHFTDIARVDFHLNGGPAYSVFEKTLHDNINGYWVDVGPMPDAEKNTLTAVVYPNSGTPFIMGRGTIKARPQLAPFVDTLRGDTWTFTQMGVEPMQFASDFNNTLPKRSVYVATWGSDSNPGTEALPKKTLFNALVSQIVNGSVDGVTIYLSEGDHAFAAYSFAGWFGNKYRYVTVKNNPNNQVSARIAYFGNSGGFRINKVKVEGLLIQNADGPIYSAILTTASAPVSYLEEGQALRLVNCKLDNWTPWFNCFTIAGGWDHLEMYDCVVSNFWNGTGGLNVRTHFENIESDITGHGSALIDCTFKNHGNLKYAELGVDSGAHPDLIQWFAGFGPNITGGRTNTILYKYRPKDRFDPIWSQGIFGQGAVDVVVDDLVFQAGKIGVSESSTSWGRALHITEAYNVLIRNSNIGNHWVSGIGKMPNYGPHTALLQNVKSIKWNYITQTPVNATGSIDGKWVGPENESEYIAAGKPDVYDSVGTDYATEFEPRLGSVGIRYDFYWTDPDLRYNAIDLGKILSNWGLLGVGAEGDYNKDGYVNAEDIGFVFNKWGK